jgi:Protein phosphatase 2C
MRNALIIAVFLFISFDGWSENKEGRILANEEEITKNRDEIERLNNEIERLNNENEQLRNGTIQLETESDPSEIWLVVFVLSTLGIIVSSVMLGRYYMNKRQRKKQGKKESISSVQTPDVSAIAIANISSTQKWVVMADSVIGKSHIASGIPCQDAHFIKPIRWNWGIAIVCDGAGSAKNSHKGSEFTATEALPRFFEELVNKEGWIERNRLPTQEEWREKATAQFKQALLALMHVAKNNNVDIASLACTAIVVIYSPLGLLVAHIGDGRAGFCDEHGNWKAIITPHKGEESNQTIFVSSSAWHMDDELRMSGVRVPECRVISTKPKAFVLMSDGCEQHSFECSVMDSTTGQWSDPNRPYERFFNPLVDTLHQMADSTISVDMPAKWKQFLESGNEGLRNESDDKTMVLGISI